MIKTYKVKGEDDQLQLSFMLWCYYTPSMNNIFLLKHPLQKKKNIIRQNWVSN